jgi:tetratricopeptide (TPR) repeat protein
MWYEIVDRVGEWLNYTPRHSHALIRRGNRALNKNNLGNAQWYYMKALEVAPRKAGSYFELGAAILYKGFPPFFPIGIEALQRALELAPSHTVMRNHLGVLLAMSQRFEEAQRQFEQVLFYDAGNTDALINLGNLYYQTHRLEAAIAQFERAVSTNPRHFDATLNLAMVLLDAQRFEPSLQYLQTAYQIRPKRLDLLVQMARNYFFQGKFGQAQHLLRQFLEATDRSNAAHWQPWRVEALQVLQGASWPKEFGVQLSYVQGSRSLPQVPAHVMRQRITGQHQGVEVSWQPTPAPRHAESQLPAMSPTEVETQYDPHPPAQGNGVHAQDTDSSTLPENVNFGAPQTFSPDHETIVEIPQLQSFKK